MRAMDAKDEFSMLMRAGILGSVAACVISTPLDVARRSMQAAIAARKAPPSLREALSAASKQGVTGGLFRGFVPSVLHSALSPALWLVVYHSQKGQREAVEAAAVARAVQVVALQPLEFVRVCRQGGLLLSAGARAHLDRGLGEMIMSDGAGSFWRALVPTMLRDVTASVAFWQCYITLQASVGPGLGEGSALHSAGLASASALLAAVATQPLDVAKTRMQVHQLMRSGEDGYKKVKQARFIATLREIWTAGGVRGLWTGCTARTSRAAFAGLLLGPLFQFGHVVAEDAVKPLRRALVLPPDPANTIVHPRSRRSMFIEVK